MITHGNARYGTAAGLLLVVFLLPAMSTPPPQAAMHAPRLSVHLGYTSEGTDRDILLTGATLRDTYNVRNSLDKPGVIKYAQRPHWTMRDLVTEQVTLTPAAVADMTRVIRQTGFMRLRSVYGDRTGRAYSTLIQVTLGGKRQKVLYLSGQRGGSPPKAFSAVESELVRIVNHNCKHKIS